jgi:hypothetical protein
MYGAPRALTEADIAKMWEHRDSTKSGVPRLKALRYNHHLLAKAVASGKSLLECSRITGLSIQRVSDLKNDPAFQELVSFYAEELHEVYTDVHSRMAALGTSVLEELQERFEMEPEKFTKRELLEMFTTMADRSIATAKGGPKPQAGVTATGAGLALQINFVAPQGETLDATPGQLVVNPTPAPQNLLVGAEPPNEFYPAGVGLDGEPLTPQAPQAPVTRQDVVEARNAAIDERISRAEEEALERDRLRQAHFFGRR